MAIPGIQDIQALATKYSKPQLQKMAQMGLIDPTKAVMAGMMIDRIQQQNMQMPQQTVADEVLGSSEAGNVLRDRFGNAVRSGSGQPVRTGVERDRFGNVIASKPNQESPGVAALPSGLPEEMAGGGIVAFADGGDVPGYADGELVSAEDTFRRGLATQGEEVPQQQAAPRPSGGVQDLMLPGGFRFREYAQRPTPSFKEEFGALRAAEKEAGIDDAAMFAQMREEEKQRRKELEGRKGQAFGQSLMMAGFGLLGAREGQEFEVLSTVGRQAVMQYGAALKDIRETERDISKSERELLLAENKLKRDQTGKALDRVATKQDKLDEAKDKGVEQYNRAIETITRLNMEVHKIDREAAHRMAQAQLEISARVDIAKMQESGANARAAATRMGNYAEADALLKELRKTNPNATIEDAYGVMRGGRGAGLVTDKEYQDAYEKRLEGLFGEKKKEFLRLYPTWSDFKKSQQPQAGAAQPSAGGEKPSLSSFDKP
jgi:hypothetical protein